MVTENFAYPKLMQYFEEISAIPRGSYNEAAISAYIVDFAVKRGLEYYSDSFGNVLINREGRGNKKNLAPLLLQGHTDMVCEKNADCPHDFLKDPLKLYVKDGWLRAEGTTLGADNGVAVAAMLTLLDSDVKNARPLQCLFTVSEEVGLDGAKAFDYSRVYARKMINMDSADETTIIAGCAGGLRSDLSIPVLRESYDGNAIKIKINGLFGGHSGEDINRGRASANKLIGRVLANILSADDGIRLVSVSGGTKENAIPREAEAIIVCQRPEAVIKTCEKTENDILGELCGDDKAFSLSASPCSTNILPMDKRSTESLIFVLAALSNGVFATNPKHLEMVEYSRNLGIVETHESKVELMINSRSARDSQIDFSASELDLYARIFGGRAEHYNRYPGWVYAEGSELREEYTRAYVALCGNAPKVEVIHAGLECGIIKERIPDMDILSCGPVVLNLHSPDEALNLASFERFFKIITSIVE